MSIAGVNWLKEDVDASLPPLRPPVADLRGAE